MSGKSRPDLVVRWLAVTGALTIWACAQDFDALRPGSADPVGSSSNGAGAIGGAGPASSPASAGGTGGATVSGSGAAGGIGAGASGGSEVGGGGGTGGSDQPGVAVMCGASVCVAPEVCCFSEQHTPTIVQACSLPGACRAVPVACDGPADCRTGQVCCGDFDYPSDSYVSIACENSCDGPNDLELCDLSLPACAFGGTCVPSDNLGPPYGYCG
jgi:hypothetical protein